MTGMDIRRTFVELQEALDPLSEKFVKEDDPSLSVMDFMEQVHQAMGVVKQEYLRNANDRNQIIPAVVAQAEVVREACNNVIASLSRIASGQEPPEDVNKTVDSWGF